MQFTIFTANCSGNAGNCDYPNKVEISSAQALQQAVKKDHVGAAYKNNYRNTDNFISSDVIIMDVDNDHTDNPAEFITADTMDELFPDTDYCYHRSHSSTGGGIYLPLEQLRGVQAVLDKSLGEH